MKWKKMVTLVLAVAVVGTIFTGCGEKEQKDNNGDVVTLRFGFFGDTAEADMKKALAEAYMKENNNVNIEMEFTDGAGYLTKLQTWISSNTLPDVFAVASDQVYAFEGNQNFENLTPYIEEDDLESVWNMDELRSSFGEENGKIIATPFLTKTFAMAYNKDLFDKAGIEYPTAEWTVEDMLEAAKKITALSTAENPIYGLRWGVRPNEFYRNLYGNMMYDVEKNTMNVEGNEQFKDAVLLFADSIKEGLAPNETSAAVSSGGFETGMYGMQLSATWDISTFQSMIGDSFKWDVVELPINNKYNTRMLTTLRSNGWSMSSNSKNKEIAWDFIKYLSANEKAAKAAQDFGIPSYLPYVESESYMEDFNGGTAYNKRVFVNMLDYTTPFYNLGAFAEVNDIVKAQYELLLADKITIDEMLEECQKSGEDILSSVQ